jgi:hypothetical protein
VWRRLALLAALLPAAAAASDAPVSTEAQQARARAIANISFAHSMAQVLIEQAPPHCKTPACQEALAGLKRVMGHQRELLKSGAPSAARAQRMRRAVLASLARASRAFEAENTRLLDVNASAPGHDARTPPVVLLDTTEASVREALVKVLPKPGIENAPAGEPSDHLLPEYEPSQEQIALSCNVGASLSCFTIAGVVDHGDHLDCVYETPIPGCSARCMGPSPIFHRADPEGCPVVIGYTRSWFSVGSTTICNPVGAHLEIEPCVCGDITGFPGP